MQLNTHICQVGGGGVFVSPPTGHTVNLHEHLTTWQQNGTQDAAQHCIRYVSTNAQQQNINNLMHNIVL